MAAARLHSEMFSPMDAAWWHMEDSTSMTMITGVMTFNGPIDIERLKATLEQRFLTYQRFRQHVREDRALASACRAGRRIRISTSVRTSIASPCHRPAIRPRSKSSPAT